MSEQTTFCTPYVQANLDRAAAIKAIDAEKKRHDEIMHTLNKALSEAQLKISVGNAGYDVGLVNLSKSVMRVGVYARGGDDKASVIRDAINDILTGGKALQHGYFGTKSYDRWHGQRSDHPYGTCPRHGSIIFAVSFINDARTRSLTPEEVHATVYYLNNVEKIQAAETAPLP